MNPPGQHEPSAALPAAYAVFTPVLEALSEPLRQVLVGQLEQFERLAETLGVEEFAVHGEFEGLAGLTQRGEISHIVQSELLLRTEAPLEFLRRLAESETLFHEKQYADPGARWVYRAMVSVGPGILGHGRMVALAALFFMARVARMRGADFHWCFMPRTEGAVWFEELSVNTIKRLLKAASYREMTLDDASDAVALWTTLSGAPPSRHQPQPMDWIIGALPHRPTSTPAAFGTARAIEAMPNRLAFRLGPPSMGTSRGLEVRLHERDRPRASAAIMLPDDRVCVSALSNPFRPLTPKRLASTVPSNRPARHGWAPRYFVVAGGRTKVVRLREGLLILTLDQTMAVLHRWFVPLAADLALAGFKLTTNGFAISVHTTRQTTGALVFGCFYFRPGGQAGLSYKRTARIPSEHLFRQQSPYAIPPLSLIEGARFYSSSGQLYGLAFDNRDGPVRFSPLHHSAKVLFSNGAQHVVRSEGEAQGFQVWRNGGKVIDEYDAAGNVASLETVLGMTYSHAERSLAYSLAPNIWIIPPSTSLKRTGASPTAASLADDAQLRIERHETLLTGKWLFGGPSARLWSDARYGGDGTVRSVRQQGDRMVANRPALQLGDNAADIARIEVSDDGIWAVEVAADGDPARLVNYRTIKNTSNFVHTVFNIEEEFEQAARVDMDVLDG